MKQVIYYVATKDTTAAASVILHDTNQTIVPHFLRKDEAVAFYKKMKPDALDIITGITGVFTADNPKIKSGILLTMKTNENGKEKYIFHEFDLVEV
jgi:hypothetical protein